jgi:hypothetical protein
MIPLINVQSLVVMKGRSKVEARKKIFGEQKKGGIESAFL